MLLLIGRLLLSLFSLSLWSLPRTFRFNLLWVRIRARLLQLSRFTLEHWEYNLNTLNTWGFSFLQVDDGALLNDSWHVSSSESCKPDSILNCRAISSKSGRLATFQSIEEIVDFPLWVVLILRNSHDVFLFDFRSLRIITKSRFKLTRLWQVWNLGSSLKIWVWNWMVLVHVKV